MPGVPLQELSRAVGIVFEKKVFDRMAFVLLICAQVAGRSTGALAADGARAGRAIPVPTRLP